MRLRALQLFTLLTTISFFAGPLYAQETAVNKSTSAQATPEDSGKSTNWGVSLFSLGGVYAQQFERGSPSMSFFENFISLSYRANRNLSLALRYSFTYKTEGKDERDVEVARANTVEISDPSILVTMTNILEDHIPSAMEIKIRPRLYLPTSEKSKAQGQIASLRIQNEMKYFFNRSQVLRVYFEPRYYFQRNTAFLNSTGKTRTTEMAQSKHGAELQNDITKWFAIKPAFELVEEWSNASPINNRDENRESTMDYRLGFQFTASREFNTTLGFSYKTDLINTENFDRQVTLMTNLTLL